MKKSDALPDVKNDIDTKRLFKTVNEISHYLDQQRNRIRTTTDLFSNAVESQRARLCSYVEKLIFLAPLEYGRKCEEILWRKCFYDVYTVLKRLKKQDVWAEAEIGLLVNLLYSGIGFYQHLITRLQEEFNLDLDGVMEFPMYKCNYGLLYYSSSKRVDSKSSDIAGIREWAETCVHRNLLYIGDLNRYMFDLYPGWDISVACRYYLKAQYFKPDIGMPHNQLGTLLNSQNLTLDAVYRYLRCLYCKELFDGAEGNLIAILEQHPPIGLAYNNLPLKKRIFSQLLHLVGVWFLQKSPIKDVDQLCFEFVENINVWFPDELEITTILKHDPTSLQSLVETKQIKGFDLPENEHSVFKILVIFIICHDKLNQSQRKGVASTNTTTTIIVAILSRAIECIANKIRERLPILKVPSSSSKKPENQKMNRRRRRRRILRTQSLSDDELSDNSNVSQKCDDSDEDSEENLIFDEYSDDDLVKSNSTNGHSVSHCKTNGTTNGKSPKMINNVNIDHAVKFFQEYFAVMQVMKISCDWLQCNKDVLSPIASWKSVFENFSFLLNYANLIGDVKKGIKETAVIPLSEDVELKGLLALKPIHDTMCWKWSKIISLSEKEEMKQRLNQLCIFGKFLNTVENSNFIYDEEKNWFSMHVAEEIVAEKETKTLNDEQRGKLMKEMGQLWLEAEVKNLESKMKQTAKTNLLTPYLVVDSEALTQHCILVKKLVSSRQFVLLIPTAVVSALDELKRTSGRARDAIRWLESQFRQGNRFLRMQRNNEKQAIPAVSYPRKKDNEAWLFMQIMECCYYLNHTNLDKNNGIFSTNTMRKLLSWLYILLTGTIVSTRGEQFQVADSSNDDGSSFKGIGDKVMESFKTELEKLKALTENVSCTTKHFAKVTWPSGASPATGGKVKYEDVLVKPKVIWPCYGSKLYGMVFADLEALLTPDPMAREHLWFVYNIPGNQVDRGIEVVPYRPPEMKKDSYRVMVMIHEQNRRVEVDVSNLDEGTRADKVMITAFESFNGTLTAGNMFTVEK